jgi:hypothetical protein
MINKIAHTFLLLLLVMLFCSMAGQAKAVCVPATPQNCASVAFCSTPQQDNNAFKKADQGFVKKLKSVADDILTAMDEMDTKVSKAILNFSAITSNAIQNFTADRVKTMNLIFKAEQQLLQEEKKIESIQLATPGKQLKEQMVLKTYWPSTVFLTRAIRQQLYEDQSHKIELEHEDFYTDRSNLQKLSYNQGTIAGIAKLYETHKNFFCNAAGANRPAGCGDAAANEGVKMGDQMVEIYLGEGTWPKDQVQQSIELMQFYLGINPPELPNTSDLSEGAGQRAYLNYQAKLARNNFLSYILTYLAAKRAPTSKSQASIIGYRKELANCDQDGADMEYCAYLDKIMVQQPDVSEAELDHMMNYTRIMNAGYFKDSIGDTLGIDKDITVMMADRLRQDYEDFQMDQMITATLAVYYAKKVNGQH